jgi:hypothetical protein
MVVEALELITMLPMMLFALTLLALAAVVDARNERRMEVRVTSPSPTVAPEPASPPATG